ERTLRGLPEILRGQCLATDVLFPAGTMEQMSGSYQGNPIADYFNEVLAEVVLRYLQERWQREAGAGVRLLEIGAGTGGTSAAVLRKLDEHGERIEEYCYTDISKAFLQHGERCYGQRRPYLRFRPFDVEKSAREQSLEVG